MPGVPSGRGCDACRRQKKKCDQSKPACSRCTRLRIACIGNGQQRYTFKEQMVVEKRQQLQSAQVAVSTPSRLSPVPSNETSTMISFFVSGLEVQDHRFDLTAYGDFLKEVPKRLGTNPALDKSVTALTTVVRLAHSGRETRLALGIYVEALKALRKCMEDPAQAQTAETLTAIYLVMICQGWIGDRNDVYTGHGEAMVHIMETAISQGMRGNFEDQVLITLCVAVILESFSNPNVNLDPWLPKLIETVLPRGAIPKSPFPSLELKSLARLPDFVRRPEEHFLEIQTAYDQLRIDIPKLQDGLAKMMEGAASSLLAVSHPITKLHARVQGAYAMGLGTLLLLNGILFCFDPSDAVLVEEGIVWCDELLIIADQVQRYRPIGSSYTPLCLISAWAAVVDPFRKEQCANMVEQYQSDFPESTWMLYGRWLETMFIDLRLRLGTASLEETLNIHGARLSLVADSPSPAPGCKHNPYCVIL